MSIGSLLWIHGIRKLLSSFATQNLIVSDLRSGIWEEHPLVPQLHYLSSRSTFYLLEPLLRDNYNFPYSSYTREGRATA